MKIRNISCDQFAGIRDKSIDFEDGINVVYGKNESGKSTLVSLISRTLFQKAKIDARSVSDKEFKTGFFPSEKKGSSLKADFIDGTVSIESESGIYKLSKVWGEDAGCKLKTPDGVTVKNAKETEAILSDILGYGEGVYNDMLLFPQNKLGDKLRAMIDASQKAESKDEVIEAVSQSFSEAGGISVDRIEKKINAEIEKLDGNWDYSAQSPKKRKQGGRWEKGNGEVIKSYYAFEDAKTSFEDIQKLECTAVQTEKAYKEAEEAATRADEEYKEFMSYSGKISNMKLLEESINGLSKGLERMKEVSKKWPDEQKDYEKAKRLSSELEAREKLDLFSEIEKLKNEYEELKKSLEKMPHPENKEIDDVKKAEKEISRLENKLCGMNINAEIEMLGGHSVEIISLVSGEKLDITSGTAITEAVKITIPGVAQIQLAPADVDVKETEKSISEQKKLKDSVLEKYNAESVEELEELRKNYNDAENAVGNAKKKYDNKRESRTYEAVKTAAGEAPEDTRAKAEIEAEIKELCGTDISEFRASTKTKLGSHADDYGTIEELKEKIDADAAKLEEKKSELEKAGEIPEKYRGITNPDEYANSLEEKKRKCQEEKERKLTEKNKAKSDCENKDSLSESEEKKKKAEYEFEEKKELLKAWMLIKEMFEKQKAEIKKNPLSGLAEDFTRYLGIVTGGKVASELNGDSGLDLNIYSSDYRISYDMLSEGTKETASLAFRLAVLDHLFPDGGGIIVLDDPFANMDAERTANSAELIKESAKKHQIIFMTCKEDYFSLLGGNVIRL